MPHMSVSNFIPKVWSARLMENLHKELVFGRLCNRRYEGDITRYGDTVHINSLTDIAVKPYSPLDELDEPEQLDGTDRTLVINHGAYCHFYLNDVDAAQARAELMDAAMRGAARRLAEDTEDYLLGVIRSGAGIRMNLTLESGRAFDTVLALKTRLDERHVPRSGRCLVMPSAVEAELMRDERFLTASAVGQQVLREGALARCCGFDIFISNDLNGELVALTEDGVTFAQQLLKLEAYRRERGFDDCVKGLSVCGAKVIQPDCVALVTLTAGEGGDGGEQAP